MSQQETRFIPTEKNPDKEKMSEEIKKQVEAYLAQGKEIDRHHFKPFQQIKKEWNGLSSRKEQSKDEFRKNWVDQSM